MEYVLVAILFVAGGLFEQYVKYNLGYGGKLQGRSGFTLGTVLEIVGYFPAGAFVLMRTISTQAFPRLALGPLTVIGCALVLIGLYINYIAVRDLKLARWNSAPVYGAADQLNSLITTGIYARVRHPSYLGQIIAFIGCAAIVPSPYIITFSLTFLLYTVLVHVRIEESYLRQRFGKEYEAYAHSTPGFIPRWLIE